MAKEIVNTTEDKRKKLRRIEIKTRKLSNQIFSGSYHSAFKGRGISFSEVREYQYGDDIRNIDWNVTARFNHPYIKVFEEEREMTVMLLVDMSGSTNFGTNVQMKRDLIAEIAAVISFSAIQNNDKVGVIFFTDKIEKFISPKKGKSHILRIIRELISYQPENKGTNMKEALRYLTNTHKKRCTAFVMSDFMNVDFQESLSIAGKKHDVIAVQIADQREKNLPPMGIVQFYDAETGAYFFADTSDKSVAKEYEMWWRNHENRINQIFKKCGTDVITVNTGEDYIKQLKTLFKKRESKW